MRVKKLYSLNSSITAQALCGRKIYRLRCCGKKMRQVDLKTKLPEKKRPFGVSAITLKCSSCKREIEIELYHSNLKENIVIGHMELEEND
jgi:hypothetical protein